MDQKKHDIVSKVSELLGIDVSPWKITSFVLENTWLNRDLPPHLRISVGWGNGYVVLPPDHPLHGLGYDEIYEKCDVDVHGGLTFASHVQQLEQWEMDKHDPDGWVIGFDTAHYQDDATTCPKEYVLEETERLRQQMLTFTP